MVINGSKFTKYIFFNLISLKNEVFNCRLYPCAKQILIISLPWRLCYVISKNHTLLSVHSSSPLSPCACSWFLTSTTGSQSPHVLFSFASTQHKPSPSFPLLSLRRAALVSGAVPSAVTQVWVLFWCSGCAGRSSSVSQDCVHRVVCAQSWAAAFQPKGWVLWVLFSKPPKSFKMIITGTGRNEILKRWVPLVWKLVLEQNSPSAVYPGFTQVHLALRRWQTCVQCWGTEGSAQVGEETAPQPGTHLPSV